MPGRKFASATQYRYGFNGKEEDDEVKGDGNQQDYGMRIYDPRLGRFLSVDPISNMYQELTPFQFASNTPIQAIDLDGLEMARPKEFDFNPWFNKPYLTVTQEKIEKPQVKVIVETKHNNCHHSSGPPVPNNNLNSGSSFLNTWFPQILLFGSGNETFGSPADPSKPIVSVNMGSGGDGKELFELIMLSSKIKTPEVDPDPAKKVVEDGPKTAKSITDAINKIMDANLNRQNTNAPSSPGNTTDNNVTKTNAPVSPQPSVPSNTFFVFKRADDKKFFNKTIKKGTVTKEAYITDSTIEFIPGKTGKTGSKVDTFLIIDVKNKRN